MTLSVPNSYHGGHFGCHFGCGMVRHHHSNSPHAQHIRTVRSILTYCGGVHIVCMHKQNLEQLLSPYGTIISTRILRDQAGASRGVGFAR